MAHLLLSGSWAPTSRESLPLPGQAAPLLPNPMSRGDSQGGPQGPASRLTAHGSQLLGLDSWWEGC